MKPSELHSPIVGDRDLYLEAYREAERLQTIRKREWAGLPYADRHAEEVAWTATDPYLAAAKARLDSAPMQIEQEVRDHWHHRQEREREKWLKSRKAARLQVETADRVGVDVPAEIRALAEEPDRYAQLQRVTEQIRDQRRAAHKAALLA